MALDLAVLESRLKVIEWRDKELATITEQLEQAFPTLLLQIATHVAGMSALQIGRAQIDPRKLTAELVAPWATEQSRIAINRAESDLVRLIDTPKHEGGLGAVATALPALAGVGMLAASVLGLPAVVSYATVTTTSLLFFSTSSISVPLLLAGGTVLAGLSLAGVNVVGRTQDRLRNHLVERIAGQARVAIFGAGLSPDGRCLLNDLQAAVLKTGETRLGKVA